MNPDEQHQTDKQELLQRIAELLFSAQREPGKHEIRFSELQVCGEAVAAARKVGLSYSKIADIFTQQGYPVRSAIIADFCRRSLKEPKRRKKGAPRQTRASTKRGTNAAPPTNNAQAANSLTAANGSTTGTANASKVDEPVRSTPSHKRSIQSSVSNPARSSGFREF